MKIILLNYAQYDTIYHLIDEYCLSKRKYESIEFEILQYLEEEKIFENNIVQEVPFGTGFRLGRTSKITHSIITEFYVNEERTKIIPETIIGTDFIKDSDYCSRAILNEKDINYLCKKYNLIKMIEL